MIFNTQIIKTASSDLPNDVCTISTVSNPSELGVAEGGGICSKGMTITVNAIPNEGKDFSEWTEDNTIVSTEPKYTFSVNQNRNLIANFLENSLTAGVVWNKSENVSPTKNYQFYDVAYGNGIFVMTSKKNFYTSTDGITWEEHDSPDATIAWRHIVFGNGVFVAIETDYGSKKRARSIDGINWTVDTIPASSNTFILRFLNGFFEIISTGSVNELFTSENGTSWKKNLIGSDNYYVKDLAYGNGIYIAVLYQNNVGYRITKSEDKVSWTEPQSGIYDTDLLTFYKGKFYGFCGSYARLCSSGDGENWEIKNLPVASTGNHGSFIFAKYGSGKFVSMTSYGDVWYSENLEIWTELNRATNYTEVYGVGFGNNTFVAATKDNYCIYYSN